MVICERTPFLPSREGLTSLYYALYNAEHEYVTRISIPCMGAVPQQPCSDLLLAPRQDIDIPWGVLAFMRISGESRYGRGVCDEYHLL
jgi:hypothetical protein